MNARWRALVRWLLHNQVVVFLLVGLLVLGGISVNPFDASLPGLPRDPVPVDAIPDIGENQQIVFTAWPGRSPRDVEDQVTYPLTTALLGLPGVKTVRSSSALGFSTIYVIFDDEVEFYWSRSRLLEKLASLPAGTLPPDVSPTLGPDATGLGQVFWYTLQGRSPDGEIVGGWDPDELRTIQDWTVRYGLQSVPGVAEVGSVGGFVREIQVDVDPEALRANGVSIGQVADAVRRSNLDIGARTLEINQVEYVVRGLGFLGDLEDLEATVVVARENTPLRIRDLARVTEGPALRRGALDDAGAPAVGGVVVARHGVNPKEVITAVKARIAELSAGLPRRTLADGTVSQVTVVPFYDRSTLIDEVLGTLSSALLQQVLLTIVVVGVLLRHLRSAALIAGLLPLGVLGAFLVMRWTGVDANVMALGGIAIAIGTLVDIGIVFVDNVVQHLEELEPGEDRSEAVVSAVSEVAPAVLTSVLTTVVSFLPVFGLTAAELRLFAPLAWTKTFAMGVAFLVAVVVMPAAALLVLRSGPRRVRRRWIEAVPIGLVVLLLAWDWQPLGPARPVLGLGFVVLVLGVVLGGFALFERAYEGLLRWVLAHRVAFLSVPLALVLFSSLWVLPRLGREYLPSFDEGAFLYMPTTMPHASIGEALDQLSTLDAAIAAIPEVDRVVGKLGRVDSALDPAPISMFETVITYHPEYRTDPDGTRVRQWRDHVRSPADIWTEIVAAAEQPGLTSAPVLMPIEARLVMLQSGMRAPLGVKVKGPDLESIQAFGLAIEEVLREVPGVRPETVFADRVVGKPYLEIDLDREAIGRYGLTVQDVQDVLQLALGGVTLTRTVEGRQRSPVRVRYMREERDSLEALDRVSVTPPGGEPVPLGQLADVRYVRGPQMIRSEDTFLTSYVLFDRRPEVDQGEIVARARRAIDGAIARGELTVPQGVSHAFAGSWENQVRSEARLRVLVPLALCFVFVLLHLQFGRVSTTLIIGSGVVVAMSGGLGLLWLYGQPWFLAVPGFGDGLRELFQVGPVHLSVAVWVGFIALVGLATDDGVVMATYLQQRFELSPPGSVAEARARTVEAGVRRIRPCLMTTATTLLALLPVITSQGRGSDLMVPLALPIVGGMAVELMTLFVVPALYCAVEERRLNG